MIGRQLRAWLAVASWGAVIFFFSAQPDLSTGLGTWDLILRKAAHLTEYAVLGALLVRAISRPPAAFAVGLGYAITDEVHQHFVRGRHASPLDVAIDGVGVALGIALFGLLQSRVRRI